VNAVAAESIVDDGQRSVCRLSGDHGTAAVRRKPWPMWARLTQMFLGLALLGVAIAFEVRAGLGVDPWDVLHQGLARRTGISIGTWVAIVGGLVLLLWIPLRQRPGVGTVCNVVVIGASLNVVLAHLAAPTSSTGQWIYLVAGIVLCGIATGAYIGAGLGPGPRDGIMLGLARRGHSIRLARTVVEVSFLIAGYLLGGTVGIGTVLFALSIGPIAHVTIPFFARAAGDSL
jgi:uncharacterized membrane protein YczE